MVENGSAGKPDLSDGERPGAEVDAPWKLPWAAWVQIAKRVWLMIGFHELALLAAGMAFFAFVALTPLIGATVMIYGLIGDVGMVHDQMERLAQVAPAAVANILEQQLLRIVTTNANVAGLALAVALFFSIYGSLRAASGMMSALNIINEERETRGILRLYSRAVGLTFATILIALTGIVGGGVFAWLQIHVDFLPDGWSPALFKTLTWVAAIVLGSIGFGLIMRWGPDRNPAKWQWLAPGSIVATVLWLAVSFGFSLYVVYISDFNATYGSLSAVVIFLMWLFLSAYAVLLGAMLNAEIERQIVCDTTVGPPRPPGQRGAVLADLIDGPMPGVDDLAKRRARRAQRRRHSLDHRGQS